MKSVLITGADGFIGSHLTEALVRKGYNVRSFVLYNSFNSWGWLDYCAEDIKGNFEVFIGDVRDPQGVKMAVAGCDAVLHLASLIGIPYSYQSPNTYVDTNVTGTLNLLNAARDKEISRFVHTSTSEVYGTAQYVPINEDHPLQGQSPYSASKIGADQLAYSFFSSFGLPVTISRPFNTYGPRQSARAVIPSIILQIAAGCKKINLGSLSPTRDFNFVSDTVRAFIAALESDKGLGEVVNFGSNFEVSIAKTAKFIMQLMDANVDITSDTQRLRPKNSEVERLWADNSKAEKLFGWRPVYAGEEGLKLGLKETINWFSKKENMDFYKADIYNV